MVFPGSGHLLLKKYQTGVGLMLIAAIALSVLVYNMFQRAAEIVDKIQSGEVQPDVLAISEMLSRADTQVMRLATTVLLIVWLIGIVDVYRISRKQDKNTSAKTK